MPPRALICELVSQSSNLFLIAIAVHSNTLKQGYSDLLEHSIKSLHKSRSSLSQRLLKLIFKELLLRVHTLKKNVCIEFKGERTFTIYPVSIFTKIYSALVEFLSLNTRSFNCLEQLHKEGVVQHPDKEILMRTYSLCRDRGVFADLRFR